MEKTVKMLTDFDLGQICDSGQCFRMERITEQECDTYDAGPDETGAGYYRVIAGRRYLEVMQQGEKVTFFCGEAMRTSGRIILIWRQTMEPGRRRLILTINI